jgi:hypothetical protein
VEGVSKKRRECVRCKSPVKNELKNEQASQSGKRTPFLVEGVSERFCCTDACIELTLERVTCEKLTGITEWQADSFPGGRRKQALCTDACIELTLGRVTCERLTLKN